MPKRTKSSLGRLTRASIRARLKRKNETPEQTNERLMKARLRRYQQLLNETEEERQIRLAKQKILVASGSYKKKDEKGRKLLQSAIEEQNERNKNKRKIVRKRKETQTKAMKTTDNVSTASAVTMNEIQNVALKEEPFDAESTGAEYEHGSVDHPVFEVVEFSDWIKQEYTSIEVKPDLVLNPNSLDKSGS